MPDLCKICHVAPATVEVQDVDYHVFDACEACASAGVEEGRLARVEDLKAIRTKTAKETTNDGEAT